MYKNKCGKGNECEGVQSDTKFLEVLQCSKGTHILLVIVLIYNVANIYVCHISKWLIICQYIHFVTLFGHNALTNGAISISFGPRVL